MHEDSCIGINYAHDHMFTKCLKSLQRLLGLALCFMSSISILVAVTILLNFRPAREFLVEFTLRKRVF